jgi:hypothetical protein
MTDSLLQRRRNILLLFKIQGWKKSHSFVAISILKDKKGLPVSFFSYLWRTMELCTMLSQRNDIENFISPEIYLTKGVPFN